MFGVRLDVFCTFVSAEFIALAFVLKTLSVTRDCKRIARIRRHFLFPLAAAAALVPWGLEGHLQKRRDVFETFRLVGCSLQPRSSKAVLLKKLKQPLHKMTPPAPPPLFHPFSQDQTSKKDFHSSPSQRRAGPGSMETSCVPGLIPSVWGGGRRVERVHLYIIMG